MHLDFWLTHFVFRIYCMCYFGYLLGIWDRDTPCKHRIIIMRSKISQCCFYMMHNIEVIIWYLHPIYDHMSYNHTLQGTALEGTGTTICEVLCVYC